MHCSMDSGLGGAGAGCGEVAYGEVACPPSPPLHNALTVMRRLWWIQVHAEEQEQLRCMQRTHDGDHVVGAPISSMGCAGEAHAGVSVGVGVGAGDIDHSGALPCEMFSIDGLDDVADG